MAFQAVMAGAAIAAPLVTGIINYYQTKKASAKSTAERAEALALLEKVQLPSFSPEQLTPREFELMGKFSPEVARMVLPQAPQLIRGEGADAQFGGNAEREALASFSSLAKGGGSDAILEAARARASRDADASAASSRASLDQSMQRRGFAPSGALQYGAAMQEGQDAAMRSALAGEQAAADAAGRRTQALGQMANIGGNIRNRDVEMEGRNVAATNAFNQMIANMQTDQSRYTAGTLNDAQKYNLGMAQDVSNRNVGQANDYRKFNLQRADQNTQQAYANAFNKAGGLSNARLGQATATMGNAAQQAQAIHGMGTAISQGAGYMYGQQRKQKKNPITQTEDGI